MPTSQSQQFFKNTLHDAEGISPSALWERASRFLKKSIGEQSFNNFFIMASVQKVAHGEIVFELNDDTCVLWVEMNYSQEVKQAFCAALPNLKHVELTIVARKTPIVLPDKPLAKEPQTTVPIAPVIEVSFNERLQLAGLNPDYSFERFVVGQNSALAQAACQAVADTHANSRHNPLFIHGQVGLGKTHLMQAIGQEILASNPQAKVLYCATESFVSDYVDTVRSNSYEHFRKKYRELDVLLLDDIQMLRGKERSQEEFFNTFNALFSLQSQIVLAADCPASRLKNVESRLISRFESGMTVDLKPPGVETRLAILLKKLEGWDVEVSDEILQFIANHVTKSVRSLEGALMRVCSTISLSLSKEMTLSTCSELIDDLMSEEENAEVSINTIQKEVSQRYDIRLADMMGRRRTADVVLPRQIAMYLSREMTSNSLTEIGEVFGRRDHGTILHAHKKIDKLLAENAALKREVEDLKSNLQRASF